ncbi:metal-binding regulatory protein cuf1 [Ceratobasidium sp. AG-Ba]|nr:metal-binding regulatory protein cuf1 [Ceratobasidium sp. AG-Ba]
MIFVNDKKYACETCIKGHRSSSCQHTERALFEIKKKGRPVTQCDHCRELRKTKQVHVRCSCDSKPDTSVAAPKAPGAKKGSRLPAEAAYPNGLTPGVAGVATSPAPAKQQHAATCSCGKGESCHCCVPRKAATKPSGHTPPPVYASGHTPNNPHPPHQHHQHAYAPYARPARHSTDTHSLNLHPNSSSNLGLPANIASTPGAMYRVGPCACGTTCACPECAHHRQQPHSHQPQQTAQPVQGHGGEPCPVRCANCFDCAGGLTLLLDPNAYRVPPYDADALSAFSGSDPNGSVQSFESEAQQTGAYAPNGNGQYSTGAAAQPGFFSPGMVDASGMDVDMDNAEFNAAMAGLDAGIDGTANTTPDASTFWDRPRCGFAVSGERGNGSPGHARVGSEVGSEIGVGSDGGYDLASELGIGSDDGGSVVGVSSTNLSMDFAELNFGLGMPQMQQAYPYPDHASQRFSGDYNHSMHGGRVASTSSQFSNHSNLSLVSSIESASVSLASLGSSHGIASLASSHGIPPSGRVTPGHSGRLTPVRGVGVAQHSPQNGKPLPRGYRRILPKVAAMTNHRPFRRFHSQQPSLHAVMESDAGGGNVTSPPPSQVLLQPQMQQVQQPRVRKSIRSHLPIVGKHFAPGGRYEPSRLRNYHQQQMALQQALAAQQQQQQSSSGSQVSSPSPLQYQTFSQAQVESSSGFSPGFDSPPEVYVEAEDGVIYEEQEPELDAYGYEYEPGYVDGHQTQTPELNGSATASAAYVPVSLPVHAQMVAALAHGPSPVSYERPEQAFVPPPPQQQPQQQQVVRPLLAQAQHSSSQSTTMPAPSPVIVIDSAMHSPMPLPETDPSPPSPRQKVGSGVGMPLTMSLPLTNAGTGRAVRTHAYDDADADVKVPVKEMSPGGGGVGGGGVGPGRKSRWPSFSVHGHRVMVGAKVMGAAYASRS